MTHRPSSICWSVVLLILVSLLTTGCGDGSAASQSVGTPEEMQAYPVSQILFRRSPAKPDEALARALKVREEILRGEISFADAARRESQDEQSAGLGGFLGFVRPTGETRFHGAIQALVPGVVAGPLETKDGAHLLYRHTYEAVSYTHLRAHET